MATKSFQEILQEKMGPTAPFQPTPPASLDPTGLAFLIGQVGRFEFKPRAQYQTPPPPKASPRRNFDSAPKAEVKVRTPGPVHQLSDSQKSSFQFFVQSKFALEADFSADELKTSFRKLALKFHPDRGGEQKTFIVLKSHYDSLRIIFNEKN